MKGKKFRRNKVRGYLYCLSAIASEVFFLIRVEAFTILALTIVLALLALGVLCLLRRGSIDKVLPWSIILALRSSWRVRIIIGQIGTLRFCSFGSFRCFQSLNFKLKVA